jgi:hypothetical protein
MPGVGAIITGGRSVIMDGATTITLMMSGIRVTGWKKWKTHSMMMVTTVALVHMVHLRVIMVALVLVLALMARLRATMVAHVLVLVLMARLRVIMVALVLALMAHHRVMVPIMVHAHTARHRAICLVARHHSSRRHSSRLRSNSYYCGFKLKKPSFEGFFNVFKLYMSKKFSERKIRSVYQGPGEE